MTVFRSSSAISRARYEAEARILDIWYRGGDRYSYFDVPAEIYEGLLAAPSAGGFVNAHIKPYHRHEIERSRRRFRPSD